MRRKQNRIAPIQKYIVTSFRDRKLVQSIVNFNELQQIKQEEADLFLNEETREVSYQSQKGGRVYYDNDIPGIGSYEWQLLLDILWASSEWVDLDSANYVNVRVLRLRKAFGESKMMPWLFQTRRNPVYACRWNPDRSWRFIEKLAEDSDSEKIKI